MEARRQLTDQQRERITHNFKAAKLIQERKRSQMKADPASPVLSGSTSWPMHSGAGSSPGNCGNSGPEFRSPVLKKTNIALSPLGEVQRKALTELKSNKPSAPSFTRPEELRSVRKDFWGWAPGPVTSENDGISRGKQYPFSTPSKNCLPEPESTSSHPQPSMETAACRAKASITDGLSQIFDEALLQEIDALCEQKVPREGSLHNPNVAKLVARPSQNEHPRLDMLNAVMGEGHDDGRVLPLHIPASVKTDHSSGYPADLVHRNEVLSAMEETPEHCAPISVHDPKPICRSSLVPDESHLASELTNSLERPNVGISGGKNVTLASEEAGLTSSAVVTHQAVPSHLQRLNESQREAATSDTTQPLLVLAGPGSGKTSTMVARLLTLMKEGIQPANILAMTFTTAAATEMRERVAVAVGKAVSKELTISTFHSFCLQLCRAHADKLGRTSEFLVFGHGQQRKAVVEATRIATSECKAGQTTGHDNDKKSANMGSDNPTPWKDQARKWQQFVTQAKCAGKSSEDYEKEGNVLGAAVLRNYQKTLAACDALDYHDFITFAAKLLNNNQEVLDECQTKWTSILVDEFQDTSTMQYHFLRLLASHNRITVVGDDDQSIFGFNGANSTGFESFRRDFPDHREVRLHQNYRSTRCIVEAASALIKNNFKRCQTKQVFTDNLMGDKIVVRECRNEPAQCALVVDCILMNNTSSSNNSSFGSTAVLYRRQVTGKLFQAAFRARKIPFNVHGTAFYRKKVIKNITALLWTVIPGRKDVFSKRVFKSLYGGDKDETKKVLEYVEKIGRSKKCDFLQSAEEIFSARVSGTFNRRQLALGKKVLSSIKTVNHVACKEQSLSAVITTAASLLPQRPVLDKRAVVTEDGGKLLNEDEDPRTILEFLLDDVNDFLSNHLNHATGRSQGVAAEYAGGDGCRTMLKAFLDHLGEREEDNFRCRREENKNSVTLTTMHQANDTETPLLYDGFNCASECSVSLEEERRLFYVAMTRARKKLYITYVVVDCQRQILRPTRFLKEIPCNLLSVQGEMVQHIKTVDSPGTGESDLNISHQDGVHTEGVTNPSTSEPVVKNDSGIEDISVPLANQRTGVEAGLDKAQQSNLGANAFLKGFSIESRSVVAALFHTWAKKPCFQDPVRLLSKVGFVIDERLRSKSTKNKDVLISLKCALRDKAALSYAQHVLDWEKLPAVERAVLQAERQVRGELIQLSVLLKEHFQQQNSLRSQATATATPKQISFLRNLGCTVEPTSRLHASRLIEQYKNL